MHFVRIITEASPVQITPPPEPAEPAERPASIGIFVSYSHNDAEERAEFNKFMAPLVRSGRVRLWSDDQIQPGDRWLQEIQAAMERASIAVLLISANFLDSPFCTEVEMREFIAGRQRKGTRVVGVLLSNCAWEHEPWLAELQMLPQSDQRRLTPISAFPSHAFPDRAAAWTQIVNEIAKLLPRQAG